MYELFLSMWNLFFFHTVTNGVVFTYHCVIFLSFFLEFMELTQMYELFLRVWNLFFFHTVT